MKRYKLIKEYPGSPKLGSIIKNEDVFKGHWYTITEKKHLGTIEPWKYPEFWEEVVEKDYEILSLKAENVVFKKTEFNEWKKYGTEEIYPNLEVGSCYVKTPLEIFSIKRLSDGEIFTVGDMIENTNNPKINDKIYGISLEKNEIHVYYQGYDYLQDISHCKQVLFTTEDGVDILKGDSYWFINTYWYLGVGTDYYKNKGLKYFSTKAAAEEHILMNKPCLSINDVVNLKQYNPVETKTNFINKLKNIVKKKII